MLRLLSNPALMLILGFLGGLGLKLLRDRETQQSLLLKISPEVNTSHRCAYMLSPGRIIPKDQWPKQEIPVLAALWFCGEIHSEEMPLLAADLLERGLDGNSLRRLAGEQGKTRADIADVTLAAFGEQGLARELHFDEATLILARYFAREVAQGRVEANKVALQIACLYDWDVSSPAEKFVLLNYLYQGWAERYPQSTERKVELDQEVLVASEAFLLANVDPFTSHP